MMPNSNHTRPILRFTLMAAFGLAAVALCGCKTSPVPDMSIFSSSEFKEEIKQRDTSYLRPREAPAAPTDVRSEKDWDAAARDLMGLHNGPYTHPNGGAGPAPMSDAQFDAYYRKLAAKVHAYKADDPVGGIR